LCIHHGLNCHLKPIFGKLKPMFGIVRIHFWGFLDKHRLDFDPLAPITRDVFFDGQRASNPVNGLGALQ